MIHTLQFLLITLNGRREQIRNEDRGATAVEWVVITAVLVVIVGVVATVLYNAIKGKADSINLDDGMPTNP